MTNGTRFAYMHDMAVTLFMTHVVMQCSRINKICGQIGHEFSLTNNIRFSYIHPRALTPLDTLGLKIDMSLEFIDQ